MIRKGTAIQLAIMYQQAMSLTALLIRLNRFKSDIY
jgi:hypothetical protein